MFSVVHAKNRPHQVWQGMITEVTANISAAQIEMMIAPSDRNVNEYKINIDGRSWMTVETYPTLSLLFPPLHLTGIGEGWLKAGRAKREAIMVQCAAYLRLQERSTQKYAWQGIISAKKKNKNKNYQEKITYLISSASIGSIGYAMAWKGCTLGRSDIWKRKIALTLRSQHNW